jgi:hypothetical protein
MDDFARVAKQLTGLVTSNKRQAMSRVVLRGEAIVKREAPVKTGMLRRSITGKVEAGGNRGIVGTNVRYARAVHEGYDPFIIRPKAAKALYWKGAKHPVRRVRHPGFKGDPFIKRGGDKLRPVAEQELKAWGFKVLGGVK